MRVRRTHEGLGRIPRHQHRTSARVGHEATGPADRRAARRSTAGDSRAPVQSEFKTDSTTSVRPPMFQTDQTLGRPISRRPTSIVRNYSPQRRRDANRQHTLLSENSNKRRICPIR